MILFQIGEFVHFSEMVVYWGLILHCNSGSGDYCPPKGSKRLQKGLLLFSLVATPARMMTQCDSMVHSTGKVSNQNVTQTEQIRATEDGFF